MKRKQRASSEGKRDTVGVTRTQGHRWGPARRAEGKAGPELGRRLDKHCPPPIPALRWQRRDPEGARTRQPKAVPRIPRPPVASSSRSLVRFLATHDLATSLKGSQQERGEQDSRRAVPPSPPVHTLSGNVPSSDQGLEGSARPGDGDPRGMAEPGEPQGPPERLHVGPGGRSPLPFLTAD